MNLTPLYIVISIAVLLIIAIIFFFVNKKKPEKLSKLASLSFIFVIAGVIFGDERLISYSLIGIGIILAVIDIVIKHKKKA
jgi:EamA domain-containing membrane protein RarD